MARNATESIHTANYAGTVIGATLGFSNLMNTLLTVNIAFILDRIVQLTTWSACVLLCILLIASMLVLYKSLTKELLLFRCIRKSCCCRLHGRLKSYRIKHEENSN